MKKLQSVDDLIHQMKEKNIRFEIYSEKDTKEFLTSNSYYKKISAYQCNFQYGRKDGHKVYSDLDFAYLVELSTLDMEFRSLVMRMCLNLEHSLKVYILDECLTMGDDGYSLMANFFQSNPEAQNKAVTLATNPYCKELVTKYATNMPIWVYLEVISFGSLCTFYKWINATYGILNHNDIDILFNISRFRNAAAHNYCLFNHLTMKDNCIAKPDIRKYAKTLAPKGFNINNRLRSRTAYDFISLLYEFDKYIKSQGIRDHTAEDIKYLFYERMVRHKEYFKNCDSIKQSYKFIKLALDKWLEKV